MVITIVIIIILASIVYFSGINTQTSAQLTDFTSEIDDLKVSLATYRARSLVNGDENDGFKRVTIQNAPSDFISFPNESGQVIGYVIDINKLDFKTKSRGYAEVTGDTVTFDKDDVYVYDKNGSVFYAKGFTNDYKVYYSGTVFKD